MKLRALIGPCAIIAAAFSHQASTAASMAGHHMDGSVPQALAPIQVQINPEARVSVRLTGPLPASPICGKPLLIPVDIDNQGFVTAPLRVELVDHPPAGVTLRFDSAPLTGRPHQVRQLRVDFNRPGVTDVTVAFRAGREAADLGGRNRIHFLVRCH